MNYRKALEVAEKYHLLLRPWCERIEIAGSLRRQKTEVHDIEFCCIPRTVESGLFGDEKMSHPQFVEAVDSLEKIKGSPLGRYVQRKLPEGLNLDIFICTKENWGYQLAIRTGPASFSRDMVIKNIKRMGLKPDEGYIWYQGRIMPVPEEKFLFDMIKVPYLEPHLRFPTGPDPVRRFV